MKNLFTLFLLVIAFTAFGQSSKANQERLNEIEAEIQAAVDAGNFEEAAQLQEEKKQRLAIKEAIKAGDFEEASRLKSELMSADQTGQQKNAPDNNSNNVYVEKERESASAFDEPVQEERNEKYAKLLKTGYYIAAGAGVNNQKVFLMAKGSDKAMENYKITSTVFFISNGMKIFFGGKGKRMRWGIDAHFLALTFYTGDLTGMEFTFLRPGLATAMALSEKMALEASFNVGPTYLTGYDDISEYDFSGLGLTASFSARLRLNKWAFAGFDFRYYSYMDSEYESIYEDSPMENLVDRVEFKPSVFTFVTGFKF